MSNLKVVTIVVTTCLLSLLIYIYPDISAVENNLRQQISPEERTPESPTNCLPLPNATTEKSPGKNCTMPFAVMFDGGRLGNQMCQYLSLLLLRKEYGIKIAIRTKMKKILTSYFENVWVPLNGSKCFAQHTQPISFHEMYKKLFTFSEGNPQAYPLSESYFISNYPCPVDLLLPWREKFREDLVFKPKILEKARKKIHSSLEAAGFAVWADLTVVTVHVRRTDYINHMKSRYGLAPLTKVYFHRAFDYFRERFEHPVFLITTDDRKWCEKHLLGPDVLYAGSKEPSVDIALLSQGNHTIVSFGTFGFVGALLGGGMIVHPENNPTYNCEVSGVTRSVPIS
ncbi:galactoside alpha-(1,2)-fucosyltransferase 1-like isoform X2 [Penaeus monodon]|nr:galactoside alpha-(1,2)-fucosyltransferase 1-like isoform X2 [Penaeus monodon]XP_037784169.1 galactoside alpha-(1,2)-fucosyltransferase 1-like isoform X2 [Penaeus monodon]XP_037784170.1 galactoside alpha-(1,2)-fucosyltransferase 1-like isoform X2 [Penaeus monodon]XP_037784171.1 galactoside alpha-(1,2)-fucosyltransferase 1-like isoform X2 [Penaeus monodon]